MLINYNIFLPDLKGYFYGLNRLVTYFLLARLELNDKFLIPKKLLTFKQYERIAINVLLSKVFFSGLDYKRIFFYENLRYYLISSYKGRCHALGKPSNGQRTWSNAWNSLKVQNPTRSFLKSLRNKDTWF